MCSYFGKNLPVVMYRKFRNVHIFKDIPPICSYFLGFRVGKYADPMFICFPNLSITLSLKALVNIVFS